MSELWTCSRVPLELTTFGKCFDKNFCKGYTSFPAPPRCTNDLSEGLTQNFQKRMAEAAAAKAPRE